MWYCREFDLSAQVKEVSNPAYFHIVIDCMVPIYGTVNEWLLKQKLPKVESTNSSELHDCILVDDASERLIDQLNVPQAIKVHTRYDPDMIYRIHEKATLIMITSANHTKCGDMARKIVLKVDAGISHPCHSLLCCQL